MYLDLILDVIGCSERDRGHSQFLCTRQFNGGAAGGRQEGEVVCEDLDI